MYHMQCKETIHSVFMHADFCLAITASSLILGINFLLLPLYTFFVAQVRLIGCNEYGTIYAISSDFGDRMTTQHLN